MRRIQVLPILILILLCTSCGDAQRPHPARGQVMFRNKPAEGAVVTLVPADAKGARPAGVVAPDGSFRLSTRGTFDGAPVGKYAVTIFYLSPETKKDDQNAGPDLLQGRYRDPATTPLKVEIKPEDNVLEPFLLK
jgi:hypothetical protein